MYRSMENRSRSEKNASSDLLNPFHLVGVVREDVAGVRLLYEPGEVKVPQDGFDIKEYQRRREAPLRVSRTEGETAGRGPADRTRP